MENVPNGINKDYRRGKNPADDFLFISDQWMKYPEKKGRRMPPSKNYPAPCEIHNTH